MRERVEPTSVRRCVAPAFWTLAPPLLECLRDERLTTRKSQKRAPASGVAESRFYVLLDSLENTEKLAKSVIDGKWSRIQKHCRNYDNENDQ